MKREKGAEKKLKRLLIRRLFIVLLLLAQILLIVFTIGYYSQMRWVANVLRLLAFLTALHLLLHEQPAGFKITMVFLILLFPLFGGVFYWVFHFQTTTVGFRKKFHKITQETAKDFRLTGTFTEGALDELPDSQRLIRYLDSVPRFPVYRHTQTVYYPDGKLFMDALLSELKKANRYIFLEFFIIGEGRFWDSVLDVLCERASHGVDVRVIYDDLGCFVSLPAKYKKILRAKGIQCEVFNPFRPFLTNIQNNRDHRKIAVIDGKVAFTGGINLADEYINEKERFGHWKDSAVMLCGEGAWSLCVMFLQMWSFLTDKHEDCAQYVPLDAPPVASENDGWVQPYCDSPMDRENVGEQVYLQMISSALRYLYITSPYLTVDGSMIASLTLAAKSGVDVRLILPRRPDKRWVQFTGRSFYRQLLGAGVKIYEYEGFIHSKSMVSDDLCATVGTVNLDFRSLYLHFECGTCLYKTASIPIIKQDFLQTLAHCKEIGLSDCKSNPVKRFFQEICRLLSPLM